MLGRGKEEQMKGEVLFFWVKYYFGPKTLPKVCYSSQNFKKFIFHP